LIAEQQKDPTTGYWKPIAATEEKLPIELEDDYKGHFMFNGKVYPIDLNPAKAEINALLQTHAYKRFLSPVPMAPVEKQEDPEEELLIARKALEEAQQNMERVQKKFKANIL
jgi:hypothetical protein